MNTTSVDLPQRVAELLNVNRSTVNVAIRRGEIPTTELACGTRVVRVADVKKWSKQERKRGPKPRRRES